MNWFYDKKIRAMLVIMAKEDPNAFLLRLFQAGLDDTEREELGYLMTIARRAAGYDPQLDPFLEEGLA